MAGVVLRDREGEELFGGRILLKATFDELCITESFFPDARDGASPHVHREHVDSFYVLEGGLAVLVHDEETHVATGGCVCAPPNVVHGFRSLERTRFLNFHTPDSGFAEYLRARNRREEGGFDSYDAEAGSGAPPADAVVLAAGEGERLETSNRVATIKIGREEIALVELDLEPGFTGPDPHSHDDHIDSFYVLEGEVQFLMDGATVRLGAGAYIAAPKGVVHTFGPPGRDGARLLNIHAPSAGFHDFLRRQS